MDWFVALLLIAGCVFILEGAVSLGIGRPLIPPLSALRGKYHRSSWDFRSEILLGIAFLLLAASRWPHAPAPGLAMAGAGVFFFLAVIAGLIALTRSGRSAQVTPTAG